MRSRPSITVLLSPGVPRPGDLLDVEARFESTSDTPLDKVTFDLLGVEKVVVQHGRTTSTWSHQHVHLKAEVPGRPLTPGLHAYRAQFKLPVELPPQYWGRYGSIDYVLEVRAHIPWWLDCIGRYSVPVQQLPMNAPPKAGVFVSEYGGPKSGEPYAELSLASTTAEPGGELQGTVAFTNGGRERAVRVALVAFERLFADAGFFQGGSIRETLEVRRWTHLLSNGPPEEGRGLPFRFAVAPDTVPTFAGKISALEWGIEVISERLLSHRTILRAPILIVPRTHAARRAAPAPVPAVGRERRAQSFQAVAARSGLTYHPDNEDLRGFAGAVGIRIAAETRPDGALATAAHLSWPPSGWASDRPELVDRTGSTATAWTPASPPSTAASTCTAASPPRRAPSSMTTCAPSSSPSTRPAPTTRAPPSPCPSPSWTRPPRGPRAARTVKPRAPSTLGFHRLPRPPALEPHAPAWRTARHPPRRPLRAWPAAPSPKPPSASNASRSPPPGPTPPTPPSPQPASH